MHKLFRFVLQAPEDGTGTAPASTTPPASPGPTAPAEDVTGLKATIAALRGELKKYEGIDPDQARTALNQVPTLQEANRVLSDQVNVGRIDSAVSQVVTGALSQYAPLLSSNVRGLLQVNDKGEVVSTDGRSLSELGDQFRTQYPAMFAAESAPTGAGVTASTAPAAPPPATVVSAPGGIISGVDPDAIIKGSVKVQVT